MKRFLLLFLLLAFSSIFFQPINAQSSTNKELILKELAIFPQPSTGIVNLLFSEMPSQTPKVDVYDLLGNLVGQMEPERQSPNVYAIDLRDKKPGYYFVKIQTDKDNWSRRITIKP